MRDRAGRLETVWENGLFVSQYTYDSNGNRTSHNATTATYNNQDMMLSYGDNSYTYTANGDLMVKTGVEGTTTYTHDALGNLAQVNLPNNDVISYTYDGRNRRIAKMVNGTVTERFVYQNQLKPAAKVDASGNVLEQYIYGTRINTPDYIIKNSEKYRVVSDERGSVRLVVKVSDGTVAQQIDYNEFGIVIADSNPGFQPFYYAGGVYDLDTQLVKFGARDYDPATGRWLQKEPLGFNGSDNFYSYCNGDPVNFVDINGKEPGDSYDSPDEAAKAAIKYAREQYGYTKEVGGIIYRMYDNYTCAEGNVSYSFTAPDNVFSGDQTQEVEYYIPFELKDFLAGLYHTHVITFDDTFSLKDIKSSKDNNVPSYLGTPLQSNSQGSIRKYDPNGNGSPTNL